MLFVYPVAAGLGYEYWNYYGIIEMGGGAVESEEPKRIPQELRNIIKTYRNKENRFTRLNLALISELKLQYYFRLCIPVIKENSW